MISIMSILLFFLILSSGSLFATAYFDKKYEEALPITCAIFVLIGFLCGILSILKYSLFIVIFISIILYVTTFIKIVKDNSLKDYLTKLISPGFLIYLALCVFFTYITYGKMLDAPDEFSHWGDIVKVMSTIDDFGTNSKSFALYKSYIPGMPIFQYLLEKINFYLTGDIFVEWLAYYSYYILAIAVLLPITSRFTYKNIFSSLSFIGIVIAVPFIFNNNMYSQVYIDPFLGFLLCGGLLQLLFMEDSLIYDLNMYAIMFLEVLAKDAGFAFAIFLLVGYIIRKFDKVNIKNSVLYSLFGVLCTILPKVLWEIHMCLRNIEKAFSNKVDIISLFNVLTGREKSYRSDILSNFFKAFTNHFVVLRNFEFEINYLIVTVVLFILIGISIYITKVSKKNKVITFICGISSYVLFMLGMMISYMYKFSEYEAVRLASFERYSNIVYVGLALFLTLVLLINIANSSREFIYACLLIGIILVVSPVRIMYGYLLRNPVKTSIEFRQRFNEIVSKTLEVADGDDFVYFIAQETNGYERLIFKFSIRPNVNSGYSSIGKSFFDGDIWTEEKTVQQWKNELIDGYDYVAIYKLNDYFYKEFSSIFENPRDIKENCIYLVDKTTGMLTLCE